MATVNWDLLQQLVEASNNERLGNPSTWPKTQILEVIPTQDGNGFEVIYSGTPASRNEPDGLSSDPNGPNQTTGLGFTISLENISGIDSYNPNINYNPAYYSFGPPTFSSSSSVLTGAPLSLGGVFPNASSLPLQILSFTTPSQVGAIGVEITSTASGFNPLIEYSDYIKSPTLVTLDQAGSGIISNLLKPEDIDIVAFEVPAGGSIDTVELKNYVGTDSKYWIVSAGNSFELDFRPTSGDDVNYLASGTLGGDESTGQLDGNAGIGENLLTSGTKQFSDSLPEGKYVLLVEGRRDTDLHAAYQLSLRPGLSLPGLESPSFDEGETIDFDLPAKSNDGVDLTWTALDLPNGLSLSGNNLSGSLDDPNFNGSISYNVKATDGSASKDVTYQINILPVNDVPTVDNSIIDQNANEDSPFSFTIPAGTFIDIDENDSLTLSASLANDAGLPSWLTFNPDTATFSGTPLNDHVGSVEIKVTATDSSESANNSVSDVFKINVENTNDSPTVSKPIDDQTATEDSGYQYVLPTDTFEDIDVGDELTLSASLTDGSALPNWLTFDASTATFSGTPLNEHVNDHAEALEVKVTATDNSNSPNNFVSDSFALTVANTNDAPTIEFLTSINGLEDLWIRTTFDELNRDYAKLSDVDANDANTLYYIVNNITSGLLELSSGLTSPFNPMNAGDSIQAGDTIRWKANENENEELNGLISAFELSASDGELPSLNKASITYKIEAQDDAPVILADGDDSDNITFNIIESGVWSQQFSYDDVDGDTASLQLSGEDADSFEINASGLLTFTGIADFENKTDYNVSVSAFDNTTEGLSDTVDIHLDVTDQPDQKLTVSPTKAYIPGDQTISLDFEYSQEEFGSESAQEFSFLLHYDYTQIALDLSSDLYVNGHFAPGIIEQNEDIATIQFTANGNSADLPAAVGNINFDIIKPELIQDFQIRWTKIVDASAGYDTQDTEGSLIISPDPDVFNTNGFLDLSAFKTDNLKLNLDSIDLGDLDDNNELTAPATLELVGRTNLELNLPFTEVVFTKNDDEFFLPASPLTYHLADGDDVVNAPRWSLHQDEQSGSSTGLLGRGSDVVNVLLEEQAPQGINWNIYDFELGIDAIVVNDGNIKTKYQSRHDILNQLQSSSIESTGLKVEFAPFVRSTQSDSADPDADLIIASGVSSLLSPNLQIEPGTIETGKSFRLDLTDDSDPNVKFKVLGLSDTNQLVRGDWALEVLDSANSSITITYQGNDAIHGVDSASYHDFLKLTRHIAVDSGEANNASFDVKMEWENQYFTDYESETIEPSASNFSARPTGFLLSEVLNGSDSQVINGLQAVSLDNGDFSANPVPIKLDVVAPLRQGQPSIIRGSESNDSITMLGDVVQQLDNDQNIMGRGLKAGLSSAVAFGGGGVDTLIGKDGTRMVGGSDADHLYAELGMGTTQLVGGADNDVLIGGENDVLIGGRGDDEIVLRGLGARVFTGTGQDTIKIDQVSFGRLHGVGVTRVMDFSEEDQIIVNMPRLTKEALVVEKRSTGVLIRVADDANTSAEDLGARDLMLIQGVSDKQFVEDRLSVTSLPGQYTDSLLAILNPSTVGTPLPVTVDPK